MKKHISFTGIACIVLLLVLGCEKPNPDGRENVTGKITLNGQPMRGAGVIRFEPADGTFDNGGGGSISEDGTFKLTGQDGVKPGKQKVKISCIATMDKNTDDYATATTRDSDEYRMRLVPREFNEKTTLEFEVVKGGKNVFNYDIQTDYKPERLERKVAF